MPWDTLTATQVTVPVAQAGWDRLAALDVSIPVGQVAAVWEKIATQDVTVSPAVTPPPTGWDRLDRKSVAVQLAAPPPTQYTLTIAVTPANSGTVTKSPDKSAYSSGDVVVLTATPASGYLFDYWNTPGNSMNPLSLTIRASQTITGHFRLSGTPPTPPPKAEAGVPTGIIVGGIALVGVIAIAAATSKKRRT